MYKASYIYIYMRERERQTDRQTDRDRFLNCIKPRETERARASELTLCDPRTNYHHICITIDTCQQPSISLSQCREHRRIYRDIPNNSSCWYSFSAFLAPVPSSLSSSLLPCSFVVCQSSFTWRRRIVERPLCVIASLFYVLLSRPDVTVMVNWAWDTKLLTFVLLVYFVYFIHSS